MATTTSGSTVLDEERLSWDDPPELLRLRREDKRSRLPHGVGSSDATVNTAPKVGSTDITSVHKNIDTLMTMMNEIAPVVKTLKEAYEDSPLGESDDE